VKLARVLALAPLQIAQALVGLGAIAIFTRLMGAEEFGEYALALSASMLAHTLLFTWAEAAAFRFLSAARAQGAEPDHFTTLIAVALGTIVLVGAGTTVLFLFVSPDTAALCAFVAGSAGLRGITRMARESDRADFAIGRYAALETLYLIAGFAGGVAMLLAFDLGAAAPFAGLLLAGVLVAAIDAPRLLAKARGGRASQARAISYAAYGAPLALALAIDLGVQVATRFIIAMQAGATEVGAYAAAFGLARPLDLLFMAGGAALSPMLLRAYEENGSASVREAARQGFALMAAIGIPAALALFLLAAPLSTLLIGASLSEQAAAALPWLAVAGLATGFNLYYFSEAFQLTRRTGLRALVMLAPGAVQLTLTALLARDHGALGAGIAACAGALVGATLLVAVGRRLLALPLPPAELGRIGAATAFMGVVMTVAPGDGNLPLEILVGCVAYALAALIFNVAGVRSMLAAHFSANNNSIPLTEQAHAR
jgi:O-antigen/teichoic acid export membrane protein